MYPGYLMIRTLFCSIIFCFLFFLASAQDINGYWRGTITQDEGGYRSEYILELWIYQKGDSIIGKSYVFVDSIYAEMEISGTLFSDVYLQIKDDRIISHEELEGMEWCIKSYQLLLKQTGSALRLEGHWQGVTSFSSCIPGKIFLKKSIPRA